MVSITERVTHPQESGRLRLRPRATLTGPAPHGEQAMTDSQPQDLAALQQGVGEHAHERRGDGQRQVIVHTIGRPAVQQTQQRNVRLGHRLIDAIQDLEH